MKKLFTCISIVLIVCLPFKTRNQVVEKRESDLSRSASELSESVNKLNQSIIDVGEKLNNL